MIDDYARDGEAYIDSAFYPEDDKKQKQEIAEQQAMIQASYPVLKDVIAWFDEQIADDSVDNIMTEAIELESIDRDGNKHVNRVKIEVSIEAQVYARKLLKTYLSDKKNDFVQKFEVGDER